jgi:hypothetical protein
MVVAKIFCDRSFFKKSAKIPCIDGVLFVYLKNWIWHEIQYKIPPYEGIALVKDAETSLRELNINTMRSVKCS